jgi:CARDB
MGTVMRELSRTAPRFRAIAGVVLGCLMVASATIACAIGAPSAVAPTPVAVARVVTTTTSMGGRGEIHGVVLVAPGDAPDGDPGSVETPTTPGDPDGAALAGEPDSAVLAVAQAARRAFGPVDIPTTPNPTYAFSSGTSASTRVDIGGTPADSTLAVSRTHVCITTRGAFACYTKGGLLVSPGAGLAARPYTAKEFFAQSGLPIATASDGSTWNVAKDGRIVFDQVRNRFFMDFQSREPTVRLMIAVSKSEDPRDGWWTYADVVGDATLFLQDYQKIGVNSSSFLVANGMCKGKGDCPVTKNFLYSASDLAAGHPYTRSEWHAPGSNGAAPCDHDTTSTDAFWVNRDDDTHVSVWAVRNGNVYRRTVTAQSSTNAVDGMQLGGSAVVYTNIGWTPQNCVYRDGKIVWVANDGHTWSGQATPSNAIQVGRLNVSQYFAAVPKVTVELDRIYGRASAGDPSGAVFDYGWPAVATNANGDIVVGEIRSNATIYPQVRASVWFAGQPDVSPSALLQTSSSPMKDFHMAGASADPSTAAVYVSQQYSAPSVNFRISVAKMLGALHPDLIPTQVQVPSSLHHGQTFSATVTILNQGDTTMPASQATLRLSSDNSVSTADTLLMTFSVPALTPNQSMPVVVDFKVAGNQPEGSYFLGAMLNSAAVGTEYSATNNQNPFLAGDHGNTPVSVV